MGLRRALPLALLLRSVGCVKRRARALAVRGGREAPSHTAHLNYQEPHPELATGRYIDREDRGDLVDTVEPRPVEMTDARQLDEPATLERMGFCLEKHPTAVRDFRDDTAVGEVYYEEVRELVKRASGASRVFVFDHTVDSEQNDLNLAPTRRHDASTPSTWPSESWRQDCPFHTDPRDGRKKPERSRGRRRGARAARAL
jgi:hypothetical protein